MGGLSLVVVRNPFDRRERDVSTVPLRGGIAEFVAVHFPDSMRVVASVNGRLVPRDEWGAVVLRAEDQVLLVPELGDGGGDDKGILRSVAMLALVVAVGPAGFGLTGMYQVGALVAGGMLINHLLPPPRPTPVDGKTEDTSAAYAWVPQNTQQQGLPIARVYGTHRVFGNVISAYAEADGDKQYLNLLIDLGLGPYKSIGILADGTRTFKINDQPDTAFHGIAFQTQRGDVDQVTIPEFNDTRVPYSMSVKVVSGTPYTYTTIGSAFDGLEVEVTFPQGLWYADDAGGLSNYYVDVLIEARKVGGTWETLSTSVLTQENATLGRWSGGTWRVTEKGNLSAKSVWVESVAGSATYTDHKEGDWLDGYPGDYYWRWFTSGPKATQTVNYTRITGARTQAIRHLFYRPGITAALKGQWEVKVTNLTADQTEARYGDDLYLTTVTEIVYDDFQYPRTALLAVRALATDQLSGSLRVSCVVEGAYVRTYNGSTWSVTHSNNPAWVCWDILTQPVFDNALAVVRYDGINPARLDTAQFYAWSQFCDALVPNGAGGTEKRCVFDGVFDRETSVWEAALQVCGSARAVLVWNGINLTVVWDTTRTASQLFNVGNIGADRFRETFLPTTERASEVEADFVNAVNDYERDKFTTVNVGLTGTSSKVTLPLFGVTRGSQAWREAMLRLYRNQYITRTAEIDVDVDAIACTVGDLVYVQHDVPAWGDGGRVVSATVNAVTIDKTVTIGAGTYEILVRFANDTLVTRTLTNAPGDHTVLTVSTPFGSAPAQYDLYAVGLAATKVKPFLVTGIARTADQQCTLSLVEYNATIYNVDTDQPVLPTINYSTLDPLPSVTNLTASEALVLAADGTIITVIDLAFRMPTTSVLRRVEIWFSDGGGWRQAGETQSDGFRIWDVRDGATYTVAAVSVNMLGDRAQISSSPQVTLNVIGKTAAPANVTGFTAIKRSTGIDLAWTAVTDLDLKEYEIREGPSWVGGTKLDATRTNTFWVELPSVGTHTYWIKALDTTGNYSTTAASAAATITAPTISGLTGAFAGEDCVLTWNAGAGDLPIAEYELRHGGTGWSDATSVGRVKATTYTLKAAWLGTRRWRVAAIDAGGNVGTHYYADVTVIAPSAPMITFQTIDNNVLLYWTDVTQSLALGHYELRKGATFAGATVIGTAKARFAAVFESAAGSYKYWVVGVDAAGNYGAEAGATATVAQPPDYVLNVNWTDDWSGTKTNALVENSKLLTMVDTAETWAQHFTNNGWTTPQNQIDAGYPLYIMPSKTSGQYVRVFDYGTTLAATLITVQLGQTPVNGSVTVTSTISVSADGVGYTDYAGYWQVYATAFRYVKIKLDFSGAGNDDLLSLDSMVVRLDSKLKNDAVAGYANAADSGGTQFSFNVSFVDVTAIVVSPKAGGAARSGIYDFADVPNPTTFKVLLYDENGTRVSGDFSAAIRGY